MGVKHRPKRLDQRTARQVLGGKHEGQERYSLTRNRALDDVPFVTESNTRATVDVADPGLPQPSGPSRRLVSHVSPLEMQQRLACQIALGSNSEARTASGRDPVDYQPVNVEVGVGTGPISNGNVDPIASEVHQAV